MPAEKVSEVRIKWVSDEESLKAINDQIDQLERRMGGLGVSGAPGAPAVGKSLPGALPQMHGSPSGIGSLPATLEEISGGGTIPGAGMDGGAGSGASTLNIAYAHTVQIMAQNVQLAGGGGVGGGGVGGGEVGDMLMGLPGGADVANRRASTMLGMRTGPGGAFLGNIIDTLMPIAPYAIGGMAVQSAMQAMYTGLGADAEQQRVDELAAVSAGLGQVQSGAIASIERAQRSGRAVAGLYRSPLFNIATFGATGYLADQQDADLEASMQMVRAGEQGMMDTIRYGPIDLARINRMFPNQYGARPVPSVSGSYSVDPSFDSRMAEFRDAESASIEQRGAAVAFAQRFAGYPGIATDESFLRMSGMFGGASGTLFDRWSRNMSRIGETDRARALTGGLGGVSGLDDLSLEATLAAVIRGNTEAGHSMMTDTNAPGQARLIDAVNKAAGRNTLFEQQTLLGNQGVIRYQQASIGMAVEAMFGSAAGAASLLGGAQSSIAQQQAALRSINAGIESQIADLRLLPMNSDRRMEILSLQNQIAGNNNAIESLSLEKRTMTRDVQMSGFTEQASAIGLTGATLQRGVGMAMLTGSSSDIAGAQREMLGIIDQQLALEREKLATMEMSVTEQNNTLTRIQNLMGQREVSEVQIARGQFAGGRVLGQTRMAAGGVRMGMTEALYGTAAIGGQFGTQIGIGAGQVADIRAELARARASNDPDSQYIASLELDLAQAEAGQLGMFGGGGFQASYATRRAARNASAYMTILSSTASVPGNLREAATAQLDIAQAKLQELEKSYKSRMDSASTDQQRQAAQEWYEIQRNAIMLGEALPAQQMLESGALDRIISQVYGAGGNLDMVASQFTAREATLFGGMVGRAFGGTREQMRQHRRSGAMFFNTLAGATQTQEGFLETVASGKEVAIQGEVNIHIVIEDGKGNIIDEQNEQLQSGSQLQVSLRDRPKNYQTG